MNGKSLVSLVVFLPRIHGKHDDTVTWAGLDDKLGAEVVKSHGLEKELGEVKGSLLKESD